jgi:hypothetical protein
MAVIMSAMFCGMVCFEPKSKLKKYNDGTQIIGATRNKIGSLMSELKTCGRLLEAPVTAP